MQTPNDFHPPHRPSLWGKLGGGSLSISLVVHAILLAAGVVWIFQVVPRKDPEFMPKRGGGPSGPQSVQGQMQQRKTASSAPKSTSIPRIVTNAPSTTSLPASDAPFQKVGDVGGDSLKSNLGTGGPGGPAWGPGGPIDSKSSFSDPGRPVFGLPDPDADSLVGTFYDTKLDAKDKETGMTPDKLREVIKDFTNHGWNERSLESKYYKAPKTLYQTRLYIPEMSAEAAPAAFGCGPEVQPSRWIVLYRGTVSSPDSGKFRFVGAGDDVLVVRFNGQNVFDHGFTQGTTALYVPGKTDFLAGRKEDRDLARIVRGGAMKMPITFYQYDTTRNWNQSIGGLAVGPEFEVMANRPYPIEILISEVPGGLFGASLLIEKAGATYSKASTGAPILPLFRLEGTLPPATKADNAPPYDPSGSVWKRVDGKVRPGI